MKPFDAVVNAFGAPIGLEYLHLDAGNHLIQVLAVPSTRLLVVGGAGSLYVDKDKTTRLFDTLGFPEEYLAAARYQAENLAVLEQTHFISWTFISPSAHFALGKRTGSYLTGNDELLINTTGESYVSYEDYAIAVVDEIEDPRHLNKRFTVVSESE